jgi:Collagen triple helix repeat (20 copies)
VFKRARDSGDQRSPMLLVVIAGAAAIVLVALGGSAVAKTLIRAGDMATGAVTSKAVKNGTIEPRDLSAKAKRSLGAGSATSGSNGANGANGANGPNGANGANGPNGVDGVDGVNGVNGINGANGLDGADGTLSPQSTAAGLIALPTSTPPTVVVSLAVPTANYVVFAKTQLSHTGAGDTIHCTLNAGATVIDQVSVETLPALAAVPVSLQAVTTTSPSQLSVECDVSVANGSANFSSLIAIPVN